MKSLLLLPVLLAAIALPTPPVQPTPVGDHDQVVDTVHSSVQFRVRHANVASFLGAFNEITGTISIDPAAPEKGAIAIVIPVASIDTRDAKRDAHLTGPDFFNAKENPNLSFHSTKIEKKGDKGDVFTVTGDLEMAGKKKPVTIEVHKTGEADFMGPRTGWETTFTILRSEFGLNYGLAQKALGDEVTITIAIEATKPKK